MAHGRPDLRIASEGGALHGNNIYGSVKHQTVDQSGEPGTKLHWHISVQNDARHGDRIMLQGAPSRNGFSVTYIGEAGQDVTKKVEAGTFETPRLMHGETYRLRVVVEVTDDTQHGQPLHGKVHGSSVLSPARTDAVEFVARRA